MADENYIIFGDHDEATIAQLERCLEAEGGARGVLCADGHLGYSQPIGGVIAYRDHISPSGAGFDLGCGVLALRTDLHASDLTREDWSGIADRISAEVAFGLGRARSGAIEHPVLDAIATAEFAPQRGLLDLAASQLGTVGSGNHYVDLHIEDDTDAVWATMHFGSRGFGHKTASGFFAMAEGLNFGDRAIEGEMNSPPILFKVDSEVGASYIEAMNLALAYAQAGRQVVAAQVLDILGARSTYEVENHHNAAWRETHGGSDYWVVRKGATPAFPGQEGCVGGSMGDITAIVRGVDSERSAAALYSTVHGAGRVMSRTRAAGKTRWVKGEDGQRRKTVVRPGEVDWPAWQSRLAAEGIEVRGGGADESPEVYRRLQDVLDAHAGTIEIAHILRPRVVVMAGADVFDPFKD